MNANLLSKKIKTVLLLMVALFGFILSGFAQTTITIGTGTTTNTNTSYPAPYGNYWYGAKQQFLIPASEILAASGGAGTLTSVGFNVATVQGTALLGFSIKVGTTTLTSLTSNFVTGLTTVYTTTSYTETSGWNTHTFTTPFVWDGVSNLVIETCFNNSGYTYNASVYNSSTSYNSSIDYHDDASGVCAVTSGTTITTRPNMQLGINMAPPTSTDLGILSWDYPYSGCGLTSAEPVTIKVKNYGTAAQSSYTLKYSIDGGTNWVSQALTTSIPAGDTLTHTFTTPANLSVGGTYNCLAAVILPNDSASWNDTLNTTIIATVGLGTFPYSENFETWTVGNNVSQNGWTGGSGEPHWEVEDASGANENSSSTGPFYDHTYPSTAGGKYIYLETSSGFGSTNYFTSPCMNFGSAPVVIMKFWYHMYGATMGTLELEQHVGGNWISTGWSKTGQQQMAGNDPWLEAVVAINPAAQYIRFKGSSTTSYTSDMSIDDLYIYIPVPNDLQMAEWVMPQSGTTPSANMDVIVNVVNMGTATQDSFAVKYSVDAGTTVVTEYYNDTLSPGDTLTYTFTTKANMTTPGYYYCGAVVKNPGDNNANNDTVFATPYICTALSGVYTIGADTTDDFHSFSDAVFALNMCGVSGPVTVYVDTGTYNEQVNIGNIAGASAINTITFKGHASGNSTIFYENSNSGNRAVVTFNGSKFVVFDSLNIISGPGATYGWGMLFTNGCDSNTVRNCHIELQNSGSSSNFNAIVTSGSTSSYSTQGDNCNHLLFENNTVKGGYFGMALYGSSSISNARNTFNNNHIYGYTYYGIYTYYQDAPQFDGNLIQSTYTSSYYHMRLYYCSNDFKFVNNRIEFEYGYGLYVYQCAATSNARGLVANNFISQQNQTSTCYGVYYYYNQYTDFVNNSINVTAGSTTYYGLYCYVTTAYPGNAIYNNNFVNTGGGYAAYFSNFGGLDTCDYNNYYTTGSNYVYWGGARADLAALKTASFPKNQMAVSMNPGYFSNTDLHTNLIPFNNLGVPFAGITTDIDGDSRDPMTPDIGADEFTPPANDVAVIEWLTPSGSISLNPSVTISVKVSNFGTNTQSNIPIKYSINGGSSYVSEIIPGPILSLDTITYTFGVAGNFSTFGLYHCSAFTELTADQNLLNDSTYFDVFACNSMSGPYYIGSSPSADFANFTEAVTALNNCGLSGPVTIYADSGMYYGAITFGNINGATATNTITFKGHPSGNTTIFNESSNSIERAVVTFNGSKYITFDSINIISGPGATYGWGMLFTGGADSNTVTNCFIDLQNVGSSSNFVGIVSSGSTSSYSTQGNNCSHLTFMNNTVNGGYFGMAFYGSSSISNARNAFINNHFYDYTYYGMYLYYQDAPQVIGNLIQSTYTSSYYHVYLYYCDNDLQFVKNRIEFEYGYGLRIYYCDGTATGRGLIANNFISQTTQTSTSYGVYFYNSYYQDFMHNSVNITAGSSSYYAFYFYNSSTSGHDVVYNNNFINTGGGYAAYFSNVSGLDSADNNNYYTTGSNFVYWGGTRADLAALKTASTPNNLNSVSMNPGFFSNTDLHTTSIPFNNLGTYIGIMDDIDGETRSMNTPDIGADEYTPPANDLGVTAMLKPVNAVCGAATDSVLVVVRNYGTNSQSNVPLNVTGSGPAGNISVSTTLANVAVGAIDTVYVGTINTSTPGNYDLKAYASLATDTINFNDTLFQTVSMSIPYSLTFTEDFENPKSEWQGDANTYIGSGHGLVSNALYTNLYSFNNYQTAWLNNQVGPLTANSYFAFDYRLTDYSGGGPTIIGDDSINVWISNDCGVNWSLLYTIDTTNHIPATTYQQLMIPVGGLTGNNLMFAFEMIWHTGDYYVDIDNIVVGNYPIVNLGPDTAYCAGNSVTLDAGSGYASYLWSDNSTSQTLIASTPGTYSVTVTDQYGAPGTDAVNVLIYPNPTANAGSDATICSGICTNLIASGGVSYAWSNSSMGSSITVCPTASTTYTVTVTDMNGCSDLDDVVVTVTPGVTVDLGSDDTICSGTALTLSPSLTDLIFSSYIEGSSYNKALEIYNGTGSTVDLADYRIAQSTNGNGWQYYHYFPAGASITNGDVWVMLNADADSTIANFAVADEVLPYPSVVVHNGDDARGIERTFDGGTTWTLIDVIGVPTVDPGSGWDVAGVNNATANHTLVRKASICNGNTDWASAAGTTTANSEWIVYPSNTFTYLGAHTTNCTQSYVYYWNTGAVTPNISVAPTSGSTYSVTVTNMNGCTGSDNIVLLTYAIPTANAGLDKLICPGACDTLMASGGLAYMWNTGDTTDMAVVCPPSSSVYSVTVTNAQGCTDDDQVWVNVNPPVAVDLGQDIAVCPWELLNLNAGAGYAAYLWSTGDTVSVIQVHYQPSVGYGAFVYYVDVWDELGCMGTDSIVVTFVPCGGILEYGDNVTLDIFPNPTKGMFSITINGVNDDIEMSIYNNLGQIVINEQLEGVVPNYTKEIDMSQYPKGVYYIKLMNNEMLKVKEIVIQ
ncbi:T9SS type A sorting domain-containing protein [candidate division KSB1 bacterium]